jgi:hypothetical protein
MHLYSSLEGTAERQFRSDIVREHVHHLSVSEVMVLGTFWSNQNSRLRHFWTS